ncbi:hypothetical protein [Terracoccus sp. 273MFTsu3.1]|uniref:hypothetical protein n=1 Tax=Terracoccus sp. 273MFTsu3.1 TaxID=1172188 RepID=UPI0003623309|nr:hypothetical protein [Terracoccus sp. 273MFTsu3.1]
MSGGGNLPIGPGIWGFIAFFVLAVALWFLVRNMNNRLRRMAYRDRDRAEQFVADADGTTGGRATDGAPETDAAGEAPMRDHDDDPHPNGEAPRP